MPAGATTARLTLGRASRGSNLLGVWLAEGFRAGSGAAFSRATAWRPLIHDAIEALWPGLPDGPHWIEAQVLTESGGDPKAESPAGAQGLLQLMPGTAAELGISNPFDPTQNLYAGVRYLRKQFEALVRVPDEAQRLYWAFASYNAGRGYIVKALALAETDRALPGADRWWEFRLSWRYLAHRKAALSNGRWADYQQVVRYVGRIQAYAMGLGAQVEP